jgi:hypothetical protein
MTLRQTGFASHDSAREHEEGWSEALERLTGYVIGMGGAA